MTLNYKKCHITGILAIHLQVGPSRNVMSSDAKHIIEYSFLNQKKDQFKGLEMRELNDQKEFIRLVLFTAEEEIKKNICIQRWKHSLLCETSRENDAQNAFTTVLSVEV